MDFQELPRYHNSRSYWFYSREHAYNLAMENDIITYYGSESKVTGYDYYFPEINIEFATALVILLIGAGVIILTEKMAKKK